MNDLYFKETKTTIIEDVKMFQNGIQDMRVQIEKHKDKWGGKDVEYYVVKDTQTQHLIMGDEFYWYRKTIEDVVDVLSREGYLEKDVKKQFFLQVPRIDIFGNDHYDEKLTRDFLEGKVERKLTDSEWEKYWNKYYVENNRFIYQMKMKNQEGKNE